MINKKTFWQIALPCFLVIVISTMAAQRIGLRYFFGIIPPLLLTIIVGVYIIGMLLYLCIGISMKMRKVEDADQLLAFWQDAVRYVLSMDMFVFGLCKFFHIQFNTPLAMLDNPFNTIANDDLMWAFYGRSHVFTLLIGVMEMTGALLLLFKKTRLIAVFFLLPICLNIFLLDVFYNGMGTATYIGIEIMGLIYLLFTEYDRLVQFFFVDENNAPGFAFKNAWLKNMIKLSVIIIPAILMAIIKLPQYYPNINGKYVVQSLDVNHIPQTLPVADSVLTKVYIDKNDIVLEYNNYNRRFIGNYTYNEAKNQLVAIWRYPRNMHDTLFAHISPGSKNGMKMLIGRLGKDSLKIQMLRTDFGSK